MFRRIKNKFKEKEVFITANIELFGIIQNLLNKQKIPYSTKAINCGTQNRRSGVLWGKYGENQNYTNLYYIYVSDQNSEKSKHFIEEYLRNSNS